MVQRIQLISGAVQKLKDFGHFTYLRWKKVYPCSLYRHNVNDLDEEIKKLELVLVGWIYYTWTCRYQYPELNFYTTDQLVILRKELTKMKINEANEINPQLFYLLQSIVGEPVGSTMLLRKGLNYDENESLPQVPQAIHGVENVQSFTSYVETPHIQDIDSSLVIQEISELNDDQRKIFDELSSCGYKEYIILEAIIKQNISDVYTAMDWCDELGIDDELVIEKTWFTDNSPSLSREQSLLDASLEQEVQLKTFVSESGDFDVTPIVTSFFGSDLPMN